MTPVVDTVFFGGGAVLLFITSAAARQAWKSAESAAHANAAMARTWTAIERAATHIVDGDPAAALSELHRAGAEIEADRVKRGLVRG